MKRRYLPTQFTSDASTGTRDHYNPVLQNTLDVLRFQTNRSAAEEIFNFDGSQVTHFHFTRSQLVKGWNGFKLQTDPLQYFHRLADALGRSGWHRDDDFVELRTFLVVQEPLRRSNDRDVVNTGVPFGRIVVEEHDWTKSQAALNREFPRQCSAGIARSNYPHPRNP